MSLKHSIWRVCFFMTLLAFYNSSKLHVRSKILTISGGSVPTGRSSSTNLSPTEFPAVSAINKTSSFKVVSETLVYDGWRKVNRKQILLPNNKTAAFDIVTQKTPSVSVFIWDRESSTATLVQEYHPGIEKMMYGAVAGMFEGHKHATILDCAKDELEEEAQLASDNWIPLLHDASAAIPFEKYSNNTLYPFLALDCRPVLNPKPADDEEFITVHKNISHSQLIKMVTAGAVHRAVLVCAIVSDPDHVTGAAYAVSDAERNNRNIAVVADCVFHSSSHLQSCGVVLQQRVIR